MDLIGVMLITSVRNPHIRDLVVLGLRYQIKTSFLGLFSSLRLRRCFTPHPEGCSVLRSSFSIPRFVASPPLSPFCGLFKITWRTAVFWIKGKNYSKINFHFKKYLDSKALNEDFY